VDADGDGFNADDDCNDNDAAINPNADEVCDGIDNDCDGDVDSDDADVTDESTWYADDDGDGFGDPTNSTEACDQPTGYVSDNGDCEDGNVDVNPGELEVCGNGLDDDCFDGDEECPVVIIDNDGDGSNADDDCDDNDPDRYPGNTEVTCDGIDNDCDNATEDAPDGDADGSSVCDDCDDADADRSPDFIEVCDNGIDDDCDGVDDVCPVVPVDNDGDGSLEGDDCDDNDADRFPGNPEVTCDGIDNDCNVATLDEETVMTIYVVDSAAYSITDVVELYAQDPVELEGRYTIKSVVGNYTGIESELVLTECDMDQDGDGVIDVAEVFVNARIDGPTLPGNPWHLAAFNPGSWDSNFPSGDGWGSDLPAQFMDLDVDYHDGFGRLPYMGDVRAIDSDGNGVTSSWDENVVPGDGLGDQVTYPVSTTP
jgi:hypothetical protein